MLLGFGCFVRPDNVDHVVLPRVRRRIALITYLVENIVLVVYRVDHRLGVRLLKRGHGRDRKRLNLSPRCIAIRVAVDAVDVVGLVERVREPRISLGVPRLHLEAPSIEEHDRDVNPARAGIDHPLSESREIGGIEFGQVELLSAVCRGPRPGSQVESRREPVAVTDLVAPPCLLPHP